MRNTTAALALLSSGALVLAAPLFAQETSAEPSNTSATAEPSSGSAQQGDAQQTGSQAPAEAPAQPEQNGTAPQTPAQSPNF